MPSNQREDKARKLANDILNFVNVYGYNDKIFAETICCGHKTLQQSVMRLFMTTIRRMAETDYDERNEAAVKLAKAISDIADDHPLPFI